MTPRKSPVPIERTTRPIVVREWTTAEGRYQTVFYPRKPVRVVRVPRVRPGAARLDRTKKR